MRASSIVNDSLINDPKLNPQGIQIGDICRWYHEKRKTSDLIVLSGLVKVRVIGFERLNSNKTKLRVRVGILRGKAERRSRQSTHTTLVGTVGSAITLFADSLIKRDYGLSSGKIQEFCPFNGPYI